jgi:hypothetical protein
LTQQGATRLGATAQRKARWRNLWRRTDCQGFPANTYVLNDLDRSAEEVDTTGYTDKIATHSNYPRCPAYQRAFRELVPPPLSAENDRPP